MEDMNMMTIADVAEYLSVSVSTVRRLIQRETDPMPHIRLGTNIRIPRNLLNEWIMNNTEV